VVDEKRFWEGIGLSQAPTLVPKPEEKSLLDDPQEGRFVFKVGRSTGVTGGLLQTGQHARVVVYWGKNQNVVGCVNKGIDYPNLLVVEPLSPDGQFDPIVGRRGDSGALVCACLDNDRCYPVGLLLGGAGDTTSDWDGAAFVIPIDTILKNLGINMMYPSS